MSNDFSLDRRFAVPAVIGNPADFLIIGGLSGSAKDVGALTNESPNVYLLGGAMGAAVTMGLGRALAQPTRRVLVVSGDGEFLMNLGSLATVAYMKPANLSLLCVDNGCYGETGNQVSATSGSTNLELIARGSGIDHACTVQIESEFPAASKLLRHPDGPSFVLLRVNDGPPPDYRRNFDAVETKASFRRNCL